MKWPRNENKNRGSVGVFIYKYVAFKKHQRILIILLQFHVRSQTTSKRTQIVHTKKWNTKLKIVDYFAKTKTHHETIDRLHFNESRAVPVNPCRLTMMRPLLVRFIDDDEIQEAI